MDETTGGSRTEEKRGELERLIRLDCCHFLLTVARDMEKAVAQSTKDRNFRLVRYAHIGVDNGSRVVGPSGAFMLSRFADSRRMSMRRDTTVQESTQTVWPLHSNEQEVLVLLCDAADYLFAMLDYMEARKVFHQAKVRMGVHTEGWYEGAGRDSDKCPIKFPAPGNTLSNGWIFRVCERLKQIQTYEIHGRRKNNKEAGRIAGLGNPDIQNQVPDGQWDDGVRLPDL